MIFSRRFFAYLSAVLFSTIIGFSFMFVKLALRYTSPLDVLADRFTLAFLFSMIILLAAGIRLSIHLRDVLRFLPISLLNPCFYFLTQALGLTSLPATEAGIIQALLPIFTLLLAAFLLKEKTNGIQKFSIVLSVSGVLFIFLMMGGHLGEARWLGILLFILSTLSYAGYNVLARAMTQKYRMIDMTYIMIFIGFISFNFMALINHLIQGTLSQYVQPFFHPLFFISVLYLGVFASFITFFLSNFALSEIQASKFGAFTNLTTIISIFSGAVFLNENLYYYHYVGAVLVILGVIGVNIFSVIRESETANPKNQL
ncbi:DMT family transporter [Sporolactobacillus putidus]|uniref:Transporter n=1 Tax=Sporolactobacillus putidus TaxID=492735 RepID=A0A917W3D6_9BACL|nr:DMT family transporter [Sporolactobacillus putidus]GGL59084.1 transporter [Sporolactobacillus putidus]